MPRSPSSVDDAGLVLRTMAESLVALLEADQPSAIQAALGKIGRGLGLQRVLISDHVRVAGGNVPRILHEWIEVGCELEPAKNVCTGTQTPTEAGSRLLAAMERRETIEFHRDDLQGESRRRFAETGIVSGLVVPVVVEGRVWGQLGIADCTRHRSWTVAEKTALTAVAAALGVAVARQRALQGADRQAQRLRSLYEVVADSSLDSDRQIDASLRVATLGLGQEIALVQEVLQSERGDTAPVRHVWSDGTIPTRAVMPIHRQSFEQAVARGGPDSIDDFAGTPLADNPIVVEYKLRSFIGVPIWVGRQPYGALSFVSTKPRSPPFSPAERDFVSLVDQWIGGVLERQRAQRQRTALEEQLRASERLQRIGVAMGGLAHDFNNLLQVASYNLQLARDAETSAEEVGRYVDQAQEAVRQAREFTSQMLMLAGRGTIRLAEVDITQVVEETCGLLRQVLPETIEFELECESNPPIPLIVADPTCVRQVVMNLVNNAAEAVSSKSSNAEIRVRLRARALQDVPTGHFVSEEASPGPFAELEVVDTGQGIPEEAAARILEPFYSTKPTGRGMGLATVVGIVRSHRGALQLSSTPGQGATFRVLWPSAQSFFETADDKSDA